MCIFDRKTNRAMKKLVFLLLTVLSLPAAGGVTRVLTPVSVPDVEMASGAVTVFFSRLTDSGVGSLKVTAHGDSLSVESDGRRREWFAWRGDTAYYAGQETAHTIEGPRRPVAAAGFPLVEGDCRENVFMIYGTENKVRSYVRRAVYSSEVGGRGAIVLPEGDTLKGVTVVRDVLSTQTDSVGHVRETMRWFRQGERQPVAVYINDGETAACYAVDVYELRNEVRDVEHDEECDADEMAAALRDAAVTTGAGAIEIEVRFPDISSGAVLTVGVTDIPGHCYALEEREAAGTVSVRIPTSGFRAGEYIVALSLSRPAMTEKRYITVGL